MTDSEHTGVSWRTAEGKSSIARLYATQRILSGDRVTIKGELPERWLPIPGASRYELSTEGRVWSRRSGQHIAIAAQNKGYLVVKYTDDEGRRVTRALGPLVLETFVGPRPLDRRGRPMECCHGPGGKTDNRLANLRWDTEAANRRDRYGERRWWARPFVTLRNRLG